ncbi:hypothetical protein FKW77_006180 [Venturia effusa]|uniref:Uncharacterized protein n=1 Tax=Venturia effusa TaxID=50376 RepID=A0A517L5I8_9PEZI|nr:hypothetical protein FKW77_006180 [Venturia effusa]
MASFGVKIGSTHAKLHRRGHSTSSIVSPPLSPTAEGYLTKTSDVLPCSDEVLDERARSPTLGQNGKPLKIKPYIRKLTSEKANKIDLSRTAAENERLAGLGIHEFGSARTASDVTFAPVNGRSRHHRTTSNNSQFSTNSGVLQRPTAPYAHPMRQTPRPYTPPIAKSYTTSTLGGSEGSDEAMDIMSDDEYQHRQRMFDYNKRSESAASVPAHPPLLHVHTSGSLTRLNNQSQSSLPGTRPRGDTLRSLDSMGTPSSRTSMDKTVSFLRSAKHEDDAALRAASIRAARIAYNEKEEAKALRAEKEAMRQLERESKKHNKPRRKSDATDKDSRLRSNSGNEKQEFVTKAYNDFNPAHSRSLPAMVSTANSGGRTHAYTKSSSRSSRRSAKNSWQGFLAWFRTRLLRLGKKLHMSH